METNIGTTTQETLRKKAEDQLLMNQSKTTILQSESDMLRLIHELQVHQIELEMQNDELLHAKAAANEAVKLRDQSTGLLKASEGKYRELVDNSPDAILIYEDGIIALVNKECLRLMAATSENELIGKSVIQFVHPDSRAFVSERMEKAVKEATILPLAEERFVRVDGSEVDVEVKAMPIMFANKPAVQLIVRDITARKLTEKALVESEEKYRFMFANNPQPMWIFDVETYEFLEVNRAAVNHYGYSAEEFLSMSIKDIRPAEDISKLMVSLKPTDIKMQSVGEYRHVKKNGDIINVEITWHSVISKGRKARHVLVKDITDRKRAEETMRISEKQYRDMFYKNTAVKLIVDPLSGAILNANYAAAAYYGYPVSRLKELNINQINTLNPEQLFAEMELALTERRKYFDFHHRLASGEVRDVEVYSGPIPFEGSTKLYSIIHDVTDRKLAQEALNMMNWRLESIVESTNVGTWEWNIPTGETIFNDRWAQIIGYTLDELAPVSIKTWEKFSHPADSVYSNELLRKHFEGELPYYDFDCRMKHKDGHWVWVHDRGRVITRSDDGKPLMMFGTHSDISKRKQVEVTLQMNEANLKKINAEKDKFFSIIAHDLRSPFNGFLGLTEIMVEGLPGMTMDEIHKMAVLLRKSATNLYSLLGNLLEWSRMQRGLTSFAPLSFLLMQKISEIMILINDAAAKKDILIKYAVANDLTVFADQYMFDGIIRNLMTNAVKFTPKGGIITLSAKPVDGKMIGISVQDTGIGMTRKLIDNLFHLDINTNRKGTENEYSTGLGLLICKDFIEKNGGKLDIESEEGKGSNFRFTLPFE